MSCIIPHCVSHAWFVGMCSKKSSVSEALCDLASCLCAQTAHYCVMRSDVTTVGKRGREISPSCFCHSQLILSCPPPLYSSSFLAAHRIWPGPFCFQQWCFLDRALRPCQNALYPLQALFFSPSLAVFVYFLHTVSLKHKQWILILKCTFARLWGFVFLFLLSYFFEQSLSSLWTGMWKDLISVYVPPFLQLCRNVDFSTNIPMWNSDLIPCAYRT